MAKAKVEENPEVEAQNASSVEFAGDIAVPVEVREEIVKKGKELKAQYKLRKIYVVIVEGDEDIDDKPLYIAYMKRPDLMHLSQYMNFVQKDFIQANKMLAQNIFVAGDKEVVDDDDLFLYGGMQQLNQIIESRNSDLVKF